VPLPEGHPIIREVILNRNAIEALNEKLDTILKEFDGREKTVEKTVMLVPQASQPPQPKLKVVKNAPEILKLKKDISTYYPRTLKQTSEPKTREDNLLKVQKWADVLFKEHGIRAVFNPDDPNKKRVEYLPIDAKTIISISQNRLERSV